MLSRKICETRSKSVNINIPRRFADYMKLEDGEYVDIDLLYDEFVVIRKKKEKSIKDDLIDVFFEYEIVRVSRDEDRFIRR